MTLTYNNCAETHLGDGVMSHFVSPLSTIARGLPGKAHKDSVHIVVIAVVRLCLHAETHPCGNVVSTVITLCLRLGRHGSLELDQWHGAWSSRDMSGGCHSHRLYSHSCDRTQSTVNGQTVRISAVNGQRGVGQRSNPSAERTRLVRQFAPNVAVELHMRGTLIF